VMMCASLNIPCVLSMFMALTVMKSLVVFLLSLQVGFCQVLSLSRSLLVPPMISVPSFNFAGMSLSTTWWMIPPFLWIPEKKKRGYFVGIAEHVGHAMTFTMLTDDTQKIIYRSNIWSADDSKTCNLCLDRINDVVSSPIIHSQHDSSHHGEGNVPSDFDQGLLMPIIDPHDLVGRTFLLPQQEDDQHFQACIVKALDDYEFELGTQPECIYFLCSVKDGELKRSFHTLSSWIL
jgi:hypothetical protein